MDTAKFALPPITELHPAIAKLAKEYQRLADERAVTGQSLFELEEGRHLAIDADRQALADAIRSRKDDPGDQNLKRVDEEIASHRRRFEALEIAVGRAGHELVEAIEAIRPEWLQEIEEAIAKARGEFGEALNRLDAAHQRVSSLAGLRRFAAEFPAVRSFRPGPSPVPLTTPSGERYSWQDLLAALGEITKPPEPKLTNPAQHRSPLRG